MDKIRAQIYLSSLDNHQKTKLEIRENKMTIKNFVNFVEKVSKISDEIDCYVTRDHVDIVLTLSGQVKDLKKIVEVM